MGLAASQIRLLSLTRRKSDCELGISINAMNKMALTREMSQLSQDYYSRLHAKNIAYYADGKYNKINYNYLMGYGKNFMPTINGSKPLKENPSMILTDYKGQVVLSDSYASAIKSVLGASAMDSNGRGGTFSEDKIPEILEALFPSTDFTTADAFRNGIESYEWDATTVNTLTGEETGSTVVDSSDIVTDKIESILDFYYPIFQAAATNGWTTEYNSSMEDNKDYVSDALVSGTFQLAGINKYGQYDEGTSLSYFLIAGDLTEKTDSDQREEITAWYNNEKEILTQKESWLDLEAQDLNTEKEAINTEIESIKKIINEATQSVFNWGNN